tara:strand:- start:86 stop:1390 length:1305 start_codon:yes stop_codon:yes gene_type:complete
MYDYIIVGSGLSGLNTARLINKSNRKICILEKSNKIGGLIQSKYINIFTKKKKNKHKNKTKKNKHKNKNKKIKIETGGAVIYSYQKNMIDLIKKYNIGVKKIPIKYTKKEVWSGNKSKKPFHVNHYNKFKNLLKKVFDYIDKKGKSYCRKYTFEQICLEVLSFKETRFLEHCYGYSSEFRGANAVVAKKNIKNELFNTDYFYVFKKGYSNLLKCIYNDIKDNITLKKNCSIVSFHEKNNCIEVKTNKNTLKCKKLILAIPKKPLLDMCTSFNENEKKLLNSVNSMSLTRIFAKYDLKKKKNHWMKKLNFSTINNPLCQIIPISKQHGLFQISYSDWYFADYWGHLSIDNTKKLIKKLLKETFDYFIDDPIFIKKYYWKDAIHFWKPNINEIETHKKILHLRKNVYIVGESYSLNQGWGEGAIQTSISLSKLLNK